MAAATKGDQEVGGGNIKECYDRLKNISSKMAEDLETIQKTSKHMSKVGLRENDVKEKMSAFTETQENLRSDISEVKNLVVLTQADLKTDMTKAMVETQQYLQENILDVTNQHLLMTGNQENLKEDMTIVKDVVAETQQQVKAELSHIKRESTLMRDDISHVEHKMLESQVDVKTELSDMKDHTSAMARTQEDMGKKINALTEMMETVCSQNAELQRKLDVQNASSFLRLRQSWSTLDTGYGEGSTIDLASLAEVDERTDYKTQQDFGKIPPDVKEFCQRIETLLYDRVLPLSRELGIKHESMVELRDELDYRGDYRNLFWLVIHKWCETCIVQRQPITLRSLQTAIRHCGIVGPRSTVNAMSPADEVIVEMSVPILVKYLMVAELIVQMRGTGLLYLAVVKYVLEPKVKAERVTRLVDILPILGNRALDTLIHSLKESGQRHIAEMITSQYPERFDEGSPAQDDPNETRKKQSIRNPLKWLGRKLHKK